VLKLTYSNLEFQNFLGEDPRTPSSRGGEGRGREGRRGRGNGREGGRGRIGKGGEGREGTGEGRREGGEEWGWWGGEGRGARHGLRPLETSSGSAPDSLGVCAAKILPKFELLGCFRTHSVCLN